MTMTMTAEQVASVVTKQYQLCTRGSGATFVRLAILLDGLLCIGGDHAYTICATAFPLEYAAWRRGFEDNTPHAGRFQIVFRPELN